MQQLDLVDLIIGERYKVCECLGEGAMGSVYRAEDLQLHREVALKVLKQEWVARSDIKQRLEHECRIMARLGPHANIVTLFDRLEYNGNVILVLEYVPGETLEVAIQRTRQQNDPENSRKTTPFLAGVQVITLTPKDALEITRQCLDGLSFAHSKGILHRDIKPSNILVMRDHDGSLIAKIMDFGIGKAIQGGADNTELTALTQAGGPGPGTPAYMAPEQIDPQRFGELGPQADLYALGVTLFEMIALELPFTGTFTELLHGHTNMPAPDPRQYNKTIPIQVTQVIQRALAKTTAERYPTAAAFRDDLAKINLSGGGGGGTILDGVPGYVPGGAPAAGGSRKPVVAVAVSLALVAVLGGVGFGAWRMVGGESAEPATSAAPAPEAVTVDAAPTADVMAAEERAREARETAAAAIEPAARENDSNYQQGEALFAQATASKDDVQTRLRAGLVPDAANAWDNVVREFGEAEAAYIRAHQGAMQAASGPDAAERLEQARIETETLLQEAETAKTEASENFAKADQNPRDNDNYNFGEEAFVLGQRARDEGNYRDAVVHLEDARRYFAAAAPRFIIEPVQTAPEPDPKPTPQPSTSPAPAPPSRPAPSPDNTRPAVNAKSSAETARAAAQNRFAEWSRSPRNDSNWKAGEAAAARGERLLQQGDASAARAAFEEAARHYGGAKPVVNEISIR